MNAPQSVHPTLVVGYNPTTGESFPLAADAGGGGAAADRELVVTEYIANVAGTGYSIGDMLVRADIYDVSASFAFVATIWRNVTTGSALGTAPTIADLHYVGTKDAATETTLAALSAKVPAKGQATAANSTPVVLSSDGPFATNFGLTSDSAATSDTGTFSFLAFVKRLMQKVTTLVSVNDGTKAVTVAEGTLAADNTNKQLVAADATRRRLIVTNPSGNTTKLGISTSNTATFAQCPIVLSPGESWVEASAATVAWRAILESGTATVPYQTTV